MDLQRIITILAEFRRLNRQNFYTVEIIELYYGTPYQTQPSSNAKFGRLLSQNKEVLRIEKVRERSRNISFQNLNNELINVTTMEWSLI